MNKTLELLIQELERISLCTPKGHSSLEMIRQLVIKAFMIGKCEGQTEIFDIYERNRYETVVSNGKI